MSDCGEQAEAEADAITRARQEWREPPGRLGHYVRRVKRLAQLLESDGTKDDP